MSNISGEGFDAEVSEKDPALVRTRTGFDGHPVDDLLG